MVPVISQTNGHGRDAAPYNETRHARFPLSNFPTQTGERASEPLREFHNVKEALNKYGIVVPLSRERQLIQHLP